MLLHDMCDIWMEAAKLAKYARAEMCVLYEGRSPRPVPHRARSRDRTVAEKFSYHAQHVDGVLHRVPCVLGAPPAHVLSLRRDPERQVRSRRSALRGRALAAARQSLHQSPHR